jgi:hypothetical protein
MAINARAGNPIAVALLESSYYQVMANSVTLGAYLLPDGQVTYPIQCLRMLGFPTEGVNGIPIIIVNGLRTAVTMCNPLLLHADQTYYPATSDLVGEYSSMTGPYLKSPARAGTSVDPDVIPGTRAHPTKPGVTLYGVGAYAFTPSSMFRNCDGVMEFSCGDKSSNFAIAWSLMGSGTGNWAAVTTTLSAYKSDLQTFYDQTVDNDQSILTDTGDKIISCGIGNYGLYDLIPASDIYHYPILLVWVRPK